MELHIKYSFRFKMTINILELINLNTRYELEIEEATKDIKLLRK